MFEISAQLGELCEALRAVRGLGAAAEVDALLQRTGSLLQQMAELISAAMGRMGRPGS